MSFEVRPAGEGDLPGILAIYNDAVVRSTAIWNDVVVDLENRRDWWRARTGVGLSGARRGGWRAGGRLCQLRAVPRLRRLSADGGALGLCGGRGAAARRGEARWSRR